MRISKMVVAQARNKAIEKRLEYLKKQIEKECISYGEIAELQSLARWMKDHNYGDIVLLEWAGVEEFKK